MLNDLKVLLVEDEPDIAVLFTFILQETGAQVMAVTSVIEAVKSLDHFQPDILISNIKLPDGDGYTLMKMVRTREAKFGGFLPAIAVTACATDKDCKLSQEAGFQMHVSKPIYPDQLIQIVATLFASNRKITCNFPVNSF
ncbi:response regulator [Iningainema sp. BLCCT55]|uniref:Response regulator n=1 Tax=Iningainema tapete BLCC-T55 TaxID=2748662 RepID=A0A8J6XU00_9CYAN|nr:response regulator [Iningainema tapete BLCC-T55]